jgi:hypothetical protein
VTQPSRFLAEIPTELLDLGAPLASLGRGQLGAGSLGSEPADELRVPPAFARGARVYHATFGVGEVLASDGVGRDEKLTIDFPGVGKKVVVARFVERR